MVSKTIPVDVFDLTIFGATGDLAKRKILPGLFRRMRAGQFDENSRIYGASRTAYSTDDFRAEIKEALHEHIDKKNLKAAQVDAFLECLHYVAVDIFADSGWQGPIISRLGQAYLVKSPAN